MTLGPDRSYWAYGYDVFGQVTSGKKYWYDGVSFAGQQFEYTFDDIGNRKQTKVGGDSSGSNLRPANYTNNLLNQITGRQVPGSNDIIGIAHASATVTVNGQSPYRRGEYYRKELALTNTASPVYAAVGNVAVLGTNTTTATGKVFLARSPEAFSHDADGNLTQDGRWNYTWDGENRLVRMLSLTNTPTNSWYSLDLAYDVQARRISKVVSNWNGAAWVKKTEQRFAYDGWNLLAILSSDLSLQSSFTWGLDLSGSIQGAGGVGGLLGLNDASNGVFFLAYDGNGNVAALVNATNGTVSAQYDYGPFGEVIRATGPMAKANPIRFSTQYQDDETDLIMYPARPYNPSTGRWLTRDPAEEDGGPNLYGFVGDDPIAAVDPFGLATYTLSAGKEWAYSFGFISIGGANGLHVTITATSGDLCRLDGDPTVTPKLKNRWFWHKYSDNTTSKTYDSDRKCKDCRKVQCFKYHRDVTWQANSIVPRPLPRIFHMYQPEFDLENTHYISPPPARGAGRWS